MRLIVRCRWLALAGVVAVVPRPALAQGRPGDGRTPEFPAPTIVDYHPRSTLVVPVHMVPRAKYPAVDIHGHPPTLLSPDIVNRVGAAMDALNLQVMVNATPSSGDRLVQQLAAVKASNYPNRFVMFASLDLRNVGPSSGARTPRAAATGSSASTPRIWRRRLRRRRARSLRSEFRSRRPSTLPTLSRSDQNGTGVADLALPSRGSPKAASTPASAL